MVLPSRGGPAGIFRSERLRGTPEYVEVAAGEAVSARDACLSRAAAGRPLGPPDLCWLRKRGDAPMRLQPPLQQTAYHWVVGLPLEGGGGAVAAYVARLASSLEHHSLTNLLAVHDWRVTNALYCCYDVVRGVDVRVEVNMPGGCVCYTVGPDGTIDEREPDEAEWETARLSAWLRAAAAPGEALRAGCLQRFEPQATPAQEADFLALAAEAARSADARSRAGGADSAGARALLGDLLASVRQQLSCRQLLARGVEWFRALAEGDERATGVDAAWAYAWGFERTTGRDAAAAVSLRMAKERAPSDPLSLIELSAVLGAAGATESERAVVAAEAAVAAARDTLAASGAGGAVLARARLALARARLGAGDVRGALSAMNACPPAAMTGDERSAYGHAVLPPPPSHATGTAFGYAPDVDAAMHMHAEEERLSAGRDEELVRLPAASLVRAPPDSTVLSTPLSEAYSLLADMVESLGWDGFLTERSETFVVELSDRELDRLDAADATGGDGGDDDSSDSGDYASSGPAGRGPSETDEGTSADSHSRSNSDHDFTPSSGDEITDAGEDCLQVPQVPMSPPPKLPRSLSLATPPGSPDVPIRPHTALPEAVSRMSSFTSTTCTAPGSPISPHTALLKSVSRMSSFTSAGTAPGSPISPHTALLKSVSRMSSFTSAGTAPGSPISPHTALLESVSCMSSFTSAGTAPGSPHVVISTAPSSPLEQRPPLTPPPSPPQSPLQRSDRSGEEGECRDPDDAPQALANLAHRFEAQQLSDPAPVPNVLPIPDIREESFTTASSSGSFTDIGTNAQTPPPALARGSDSNKIWPAGAPAGLSRFAREATPDAEESPPQVGRSDSDKRRQEASLAASMQAIELEEGGRDDPDAAPKPVANLAQSFESQQQSDPAYAQQQHHHQEQRQEQQQQQQREQHGSQQRRRRGRASRNLRERRERRRAAATAAALSSGKAECAEWLDTLVHALYQDLRVYMDWRAAEARAERGPVGDAPEHEAEYHQALLFSSHFDSHDWARRGELCERLGRLEDAERSYRAAVHEGFSATAWMRLLAIYSELGWTRETLTAAGQLLAACAPDGSGAHAKDATHAHAQRAPYAVEAAVCRLVAQRGLQAVREEQEEVGSTHAVLNALFHCAVKWQVAGFHR